MQVCNKCGQPIVFQRTSRGKFQPLDASTREPHFSTCKRITDPETLTREYWAPREANKNRNAPVTNPLNRRQFYRGPIPPWEHPTFIECYE